MADSLEVAKAQAELEEEKAAERKRKALLEKGQAQESLFEGYKPAIEDIYGRGKEDIFGVLGEGQAEIEGLYGAGRTRLEGLIGEQSGLRMKESLAPIEGTLQRKGLLSGESGALNEALAGASERIYTEGLGRLADYDLESTRGLASVLRGGTEEKSALERALMEGRISLEDYKQRTGLGLIGEQAGVETEGADRLLEETFGLGATAFGQEFGAEEAQKARESADARLESIQEEKRENLRDKQTAWDREYQAIYGPIFRQNLWQGSDAAKAMAEAEVSRRIGSRPA